MEDLYTAPMILQSNLSHDTTEGLEEMKHEGTGRMRVAIMTGYFTCPS